MFLLCLLTRVVTLFFLQLFQVLSGDDHPLAESQDTGTSERNVVLQEDKGPRHVCRIGKCNVEDYGGVWNHRES